MDDVADEVLRVAPQDVHVPLGGKSGKRPVTTQQTNNPPKRVCVYLNNEWLFLPEKLKTFACVNQYAGRAKRTCLHLTMTTRPAVDGCCLLSPMVPLMSPPEAKKFASAEGTKALLRAETF